MKTLVKALSLPDIGIVINKQVLLHLEVLQAALEAFRRPQLRG